ncbi:MAG: hypothetical protein Hyperionvirus1_112 [Hyperionvirus sp.]|uniref:Uncharacterized protein n=1 Tax=Hyperionvirus sp. TaxID=2487770 RepID=A0A3G5A9L8_9VIRU|nr:MAG: hypothetical protein Hyperionvirus1_112 [Hyperionvirus sp.]
MICLICILISAWVILFFPKSQKNGLQRIIQSFRFADYLNTKKCKTCHNVGKGIPFIPGVIIIDGHIDRLMGQSFMYQYQKNIKIDEDYSKCSCDRTKPLTIIIRTTGGKCSTILQTLYKHKGHKTCYVYDYSYSLGTLIALFCDTIYFTKGAELSPVDIQNHGKPLLGTLQITLNELLYDPQAVIKKISPYPKLSKLFISDLETILHVFKIHKSIDKIKFLELFFNNAVSHHVEYGLDEIKAIGFNVGRFSTSPDYSKIRRIIMENFTLNSNDASF